MNRRNFVSSLAVAPLGASLFTQSRAVERSTPPHGSDPWLEINLGNLTWNIQQISKRVEGRPILAVLKNNAYGLGLTGTARHLETIEAVHGYAVFKVSEALELRDSRVEKPILVFGPASDEELEELARRGITPSIYTDRSAMLSRLADRLGRPVGIQLYIDTGLGRQGVPWRDVPPFLEKLSRVRGVTCVGTLTALTEDADFDREQLDRFDQVFAQAQSLGLELGRRHAASSAAVFHAPEAFLDMVRPGIGVYGCYPDEKALEGRKLDLKPALSLKARVIYIKRLRVGDSLQYHKAYVARKPVWVATLPVGYNDGYPRAAAGKCEVLVNGRPYPVIASLSSNHTLIEIGDEPTVRAGDVVTLMGDGPRAITPHEISRRTGESVYGLLMGMNPLLPRIFG